MTAAERWAELVRSRRATLQVRQPDRSRFWESQAGRFAYSMRRQADPFWDFLQPWLAPGRTAIDVGAGTGRHAAPLAERLDWVTAVEPEEAMRHFIPERENMTVVASTWEEAEVAPADLVLASHVLYAVEDGAGFLAKMNALARVRAFVVLREGQQPHPADRLAGNPPEPVLGDAVELLRELGLRPEVERWRARVVYEWQDEAQALADWRLRGWKGSLEGVERRPDGSLAFDAGEQPSGVAHWQPRS